MRWTNSAARMGAFDRLERETAEGELWSRYDHVLGASAWLAVPHEAIRVGRMPIGAAESCGC